MEPIFVEFGNHVINLCHVESIHVVEVPYKDGGQVFVRMNGQHEFTLEGSQTIDFMRHVGRYMPRSL